MIDRRIDRLARALATNASRRKAALGALAIGATALVGARRSEAQAPAPAATTICAGDGQPCVMLTGCCSGFTCVTNAINPNQGFCQSGGSGGVEIAPPMAAANASGSTQPAPTKTPRTHKTHTPGSNHTNTNTNTRPSTAIKVTSIACYPPADDPVGPHVTVRNVGSDSVTLGNLAALRNPAYNNPAKGKDVPITLDPNLKPKRSITFVVSEHASGGHDSAVHLPADFFSTDPADVGNEGVKITYDGVAGSSLTLTAMCPDRPATSSSAQTTKSARKKRRR